MAARLPVFTISSAYTKPYNTYILTFMNHNFAVFSLSASSGDSLTTKGIEGKHPPKLQQNPFLLPNTMVNILLPILSCQGRYMALWKNKNKTNKKQTNKQMHPVKI